MATYLLYERSMYRSLNTRMPSGCVLGVGIGGRGWSLKLRGGISYRPTGRCKLIQGRDKKDMELQAGMLYSWANTACYRIQFTLASRTDVHISSLEHPERLFE